MNIDQIINRIKSVPKEKWNDEETLKSLFRQTANEAGKSLTEDEIDQLFQQFKSLLEGGSQEALLSLLLRHGISKSQLDEMGEKFQS
ncbi:hypothetical protein ACI7RC_10110 [Brevibacillus sp. B_LB10_24]|uniref:hypothetical protein n=1 Tax=Brevibacillus sp. B_LB10_24 TaxID=3380645 RepID=UPI0038BAC981